MAPFELAEPLLTVRGHNIRSSDVVMWGAIAVAVPGAVRTAEPPRRMLLLGVLAWVALLSISTWLADERAVSIVSLRRLVAGAAFGLLVSSLASSAAARRTIAWGLVVGTTVAAAYGLIVHVVGAPGFDSSLAGRITQFGPIERLTRPYPHANVAGAAHACGALIALGLALEREGVRRLGLVTAASSSVLALVFTYGRSALVSFVVGAGVFWLLRRRHGLSTPSPIVVLALVGALGLVMVVDPNWRLRVVEPAPAHWYSTDIDAPPTLVPGEAITVGVTNTSATDWEGQEGLCLLVTGVDGAGTQERLDCVAFVGLRRGESVELTAFVDPPTDTMIIEWDVQRPREGRFLRLSGLPPVVSSIDGRVADGVVSRDTERASRPELWRAALELAAAHPLFGVGTGNFRLHYQAVTGIDGPRTTHAHSAIFEPLASWGLPAAALFWVGAVWVVGVRRHSDEPLDHGLMAAAAVLACAGLTDWLLESATIGPMFWAIAGMLARLSSDGGPNGDGRTAQPSSSPSTDATIRPVSDQR